MFLTGQEHSHANKDQRIQELEALLEKISLGKYMWETTFDAITNPVMIISKDYMIERANLAAARISQIDVRLMIGAKCHEMLAGSSTPCKGCPLEQTLSSKKPRIYTLEPFEKSGRQFDVHAYPIDSARGQGQAVLYYRDVTEEKHLQRKLLHSEKMAAIGTLAGGVAHEINNPLGGILAFAQLAMRDLPSNHHVQNDLKEIEEAALRCKRIVQDLLDFSRRDSEEGLTLLQINDVIKKIIPILKLQAKTKGIEIECELEKDILPIKGNFHKLEQVFLNLATNAIQAMGKGGKLVFKTNMGSDGDLIIIEVSDTGEGILPEYLGKIFDPYFTTKKQGEGTGLGLAISYGIVQEHGGQIEVKSEPGKGTQVFVSFSSAGLNSRR